MEKFTIDYSMPIEKRVALAEESLPWIIKVSERVICDHCYDESGRYLARSKEYQYKLFEFPEGTSTKMINYRIRRKHWIPANPAHMLAFAAGGFKAMPEFPSGTWHHYVVGLGGDLHTVLGAQFGGLNSGMCFFFQHVSQDKPMHQGGENCRFLGVRENWR